MNHALKKTDTAIIASMEAAGVPRSCWGISTTETGRKSYRDFCEEAKERRHKRELQTSAYMHYSPTNAGGVLDAEVMAKELVLAGIPTRYTTFYKLMRDLRLQDIASDLEEDALYKVYGKGAFVVPAIPFMDELAPADMRQYNETIEYLINHAHEGGMLVTAGNNLPTKRYKSGWPVLFERLLVENSRIFEVR